MSRKLILDKLRQANGKAGIRELTALPTGFPRPPLEEELLSRLRAQFSAHQVRFGELDSRDELPAYLQNHCNPARVTPLSLATGESRFFDDISWQECDCERLPASAARRGGIGLSVALCAVAETGSLVLCAGADNPTSLNFLPEYHVVVFSRADLVAGFEDMWEHLRRTYADGLPRAINLVSGPSSTADVAMTFAYGVHGPVQFHALLIN